MRILWFSNTPANISESLGLGITGGGWLKSLDRELQKHIELHVAYYYPQGGVPVQYKKTTYYPIGSRYWRLKSLFRKLIPSFIDGHDLPKYLEIIGKVKPDLIHIHGTENPFGYLLPYTEIPVVLSFQGSSIACYNKFMVHFTKKHLRSSIFSGGMNLRRILLDNTFLQVRKEFRKMAAREERNLLKVKNIIGRTDWDRRISSVLAPGCKYYHGDEILRESFNKKRWSLSDKNKLIIHSTCGNSPYKGFETICEALYLLNENTPVETEWRVAGVGPDDQIVRATRRKLKYRFPGKGLVLPGKVGEDELSDMMCEANIYVSPSHIENSSNSLCEAMMLGMPCVATFAGGTGSILKDKEEGILIQDGDPWVMAGAVYELYQNKDLCLKYGENARKHALQRHNSEKIVEELLEIYRQVISGSEQER